MTWPSGPNLYYYIILYIMLYILYIILYILYIIYIFYILFYIFYYILYYFGPNLIKISYFTAKINIKCPHSYRLMPGIWSEWGRVPERDMLSLGVMGMGAGGLRKFFRRCRRRRRRRPPPKVGFGWKSMKYVEIYEICLTILRRSQKCDFVFGAWTQ